MEMSSTTFQDKLPEALKQGLVTEATINNAVRNILVAKYKLGLFKNPYIDPSQTASQMVTPEQRATARNLAIRKPLSSSAIENNLLPLALYRRPAYHQRKIHRPHRPASRQQARHHGLLVPCRPPLRHRHRPRRHARTLTAPTNIHYTKGVEIEREQPSIFDAQFSSPKPTMTTDAERDAEFHHAIDLINQSDVAVLVLGELQSMSGERASRSSLDLPGKQEQLLEAAVATGKPIVLVLLNARPLNITWASKHVPAILEAWYPGTEGGNAIADLLSGDANPGGKLPIAWPLTIGQVPINYARNLTQIPEAPNTRYWDGSSAPLYPFGYGLSYSTFTTSNLHIARPHSPRRLNPQVSIDVQNTSNRAGDEVVQLYTHQRAGSASRPVRELKGFLRVSLKPNETRTVTIPLNTKDLGFWSPQTHHWSMEPGTFDLWAGTDETATAHATFELLP